MSTMREYMEMHLKTLRELLLSKAHNKLWFDCIKLEARITEATYLWVEMMSRGLLGDEVDVTWTTLLVQIGRTPDSIKLFNEEFIKFTGMDINGFKNHPKTVMGEAQSEGDTQWSNGEFILSFGKDDCLYTLARMSNG